MRVNNAVQDEIIRRIDAIDKGVFQPMLEQPVMQALLASIGLFVGEYLKVRFAVNFGYQRYQVKLITGG
jgi:hypothetical protein